MSKQENTPITYPDRYLRLRDVVEMTTLAGQQIRRLYKEGLFPRPRYISDRRLGWLLSEVLEWMRSRPVQSDYV